ncbi:collagen alpha-1(I) chain-like [Mustela nigripes]|uniref:collagen alpha-1(I) chain-like n=1 Tax=Mustela nigripes TaxID=77151 RepID=UPI0028164BC1|nr:collagen alpha-1(I) chain-like [Mustela nigripes]
MGEKGESLQGTRGGDLRRAELTLRVRAVELRDTRPPPSGPGVSPQPPALRPCATPDRLTPEQAPPRRRSLAWSAAAPGSVPHAGDRRPHDALRARRPPHSAPPGRPSRTALAAPAPAAPTRARRRLLVRSGTAREPEADKVTRRVRARGRPPSPRRSERSGSPRARRSRKADTEGGRSRARRPQHSRPAGLREAQPRRQRPAGRARGEARPAPPAARPVERPGHASDGARVTWGRGVLRALRSDARLGLPRGGPRRRGRGGAKEAGRGAGPAEERGGRRGARGRGGPGVLWDAAVEWRWARDFEQTRVCVSEAPPPPLLLGAEGARREEQAAAPPAALVSVSPGGGDLWAGGRAGGAGPPRRVVARAEGAGPPPAGARAGGARRGAAESGNLRAGGRRAASSGRGGRGGLPARPLPAGARLGGCHPAGPALARPSAPRGRREDGFRRLLTRTLRGPRSRLSPRVPGSRFCCCVISSQRRSPRCPPPLLPPPFVCARGPAAGRPEPGRATVNSWRGRSEVWRRGTAGLGGSGTPGRSGRARRGAAGSRTGSSPRRRQGVGRPVRRPPRPADTGRPRGPWRPVLGRETPRGGRGRAGGPGLSRGGFGVAGASRTQQTGPTRVPSHVGSRVVGLPGTMNTLVPSRGHSAAGGAGGTLCEPSCGATRCARADAPGGLGSRRPRTVGRPAGDSGQRRDFRASAAVTPQRVPTSERRRPGGTRDAGPAAWLGSAFGTGARRVWAASSRAPGPATADWVWGQGGRGGTPASCPAPRVGPRRGEPRAPSSSPQVACLRTRDFGFFIVLPGGSAARKRAGPGARPPCGRRGPAEAPPSAAGRAVSASARGPPRAFEAAAAAAAPGPRSAPAGAGWRATRPAGAPERGQSQPRRAPSRPGPPGAPTAERREEEAAAAGGTRLPPAFGPRQLRLSVASQPPPPTPISWIWRLSRVTRCGAQTPGSEGPAAAAPPRVAVRVRRAGRPRGWRRGVVGAVVPQDGASRRFARELPRGTERLCGRRSWPRFNVVGVPEDASVSGIVRQIPREPGCGSPRRGPRASPAVAAGGSVAGARGADWKCGRRVCGGRGCPRPRFPRRRDVSVTCGAAFPGPEKPAQGLSRAGRVRDRTVVGASRGGPRKRRFAVCETLPSRAWVRFGSVPTAFMVPRWVRVSRLRSSW